MDEAGPPPQWHETPSLVALRDAMIANGRVRHAVARAAGVSESELRALEVLARHTLGPAELAQHLDVSTAAVTGILDRLEKHGHVQRSPHPNDRRRLALAVTDSGYEEVRTHLLPMWRALHELDTTFTDAERDVVARYLTAVTRAFGEIAEPDAD